MVIDKSWTLLERHEKAFYTGLTKFVDDCKPLVNSAGNIKCPCKSCRTVLWVSIKNLPKHITRYGWDPGYKTWVHHGEPDLPPPLPVIDNTRQPQMSDMIALLNDLSYIPPNNEQNEPTQGDIGETSNEPTQAKRNEFEELYASANEELYPGCDYVTRLDFMAKFTYFKVKVRWKTINTPGKKVPKKVLRYFSIIPRLQRLYKSSHTAKEMTWHATGKCTEPGKMQHPVDGRAWKNFDTKYPNFAKEPRNVRLGLAADGFNPFGNLSQAYSYVVRDMTYLQLPPVAFDDDLKVLWALKGVETIDVATGQKFNMRAMVLWTINDFPARSSLSGWSGQGYKACPTCNKDTPYVCVLGKIAYVGHRRFLKKPHKWRMSLEFNGEIKNRDPPRKFDRDQIQAQLAKLPTRVKGKHPSYGGVKIKHNVYVKLNWTKRSLSYASLGYPPTFFDIMIYLVIHLPLEALEGGPIRPRWMFPFERFMKKLKGYVQNKAKPEGSIAEGYVAEEALTFSSHYFRDVTTKFNRPDRNVDPPPLTCQFQVFRSLCKSIGLRSVIRFDAQELKKVIMVLYSQHSGNLTTYLVPVQVIRQRHVDNDPGVSATSELFALACGPTPTPISVNSCVVNGVRFVVHSRDERRTTQNNGICSPGGKDGEMYYGQLQEILEFSYLSFKVVLFRVKWFDTSNEGRKVKHLVLRNNMTQILTKSEAFKDDQYILVTSQTMLLP
ncbi:gag-pol polyprotein [Tanacetum coccineum]|uniref:Gag-pol polyprotein n=1 Tax=Tanacetum coccineum TaxID=301880 RepID=A0ABQ5EX42_9ASTR